ncbi:hypothetical protein [Coralliovum pocilloporae]|uniref:hypothetical protein n=1 Tax=Coralliovum pocilloporae TaxID=3066369 RepID=UPI003306BD26
MPLNRSSRLLTTLSLCALALAGCSSSGGTSGSGQSETSLLDTFIRGTTEEYNSDVTAQAPVLCPSVDIQSGTKVVQVFERGHNDDPGYLRYQATIADVARECSLDGLNITMKIGAAGRALTGPKGSAETVALPIRFAVVRADGTVVFSELSKTEVAFTSPTDSKTFSAVVQTPPFPITRGERVRVLIGFDDQAKQ